MSIQSNSSARPRTLAVLALLATQALILGFVLFMLLKATGGTGRFLYLAGETPALTLLALQTIVSTTLGIVALWRRVPAHLHLIAPVALLGASLLLRVIGVEAAIEETNAATDPQQAATWLLGLARTDLPHAAALLIIGAGGLSALASVALPGFHHRRRDTPYLLAGVIYGVGALTTFVCANLGLMAGPGAGVFAPGLLFLAPCFFGFVLAGIAAPGIAAPAQRQSDASFNALVAGLGLVGGLLALARGLSHFVALNTLQTAAQMAPARMLSDLLRIADHIDTLGVIMVVVSLAVAVSLLVVSRNGALRWTRARKAELALIGVLLVAGWTSINLGGTHVYRQNRSMMENLPMFQLEDEVPSSGHETLSTGALARGLALRDWWPSDDG